MPVVLLNSEKNGVQEANIYDSMRSTDTGYGWYFSVNEISVFHMWHLSWEIEYEGAYIWVIAFHTLKHVFVYYFYFISFFIFSVFVLCTWGKSQSYERRSQSFANSLIILLKIISLIYFVVS